MLALQWLQTKEEWDREKVYLAELGYVPDEADPEVSLHSLSDPFLCLLRERARENAEPVEGGMETHPPVSVTCGP